MRGGRDEGFILFPGAIYVIVFANFSKCIKIYIVIIIICVTGRVACKQMMPKDERRSIGEGKKERERRV